MGDNEATSVARYASIAAIVILIIGILGNTAYSTYQILRWIVCGASIVNIIKYYEKNKIFIAIFIFIAILFNPISPIFMTRSSWLIFDALTLMVFIGSLVK
jgi:hypothetical protein